MPKHRSLFIIIIIWKSVLFIVLSVFLFSLLVVVLLLFGIPERERMIAKILFTVISFSFSFNYFITQWFIFCVVHWNKYEWIFWIAFRLYSDAVGVSCSCRNAKWFLIHWSLDQLRRFIGWYHCYDSQSWLAARYPFGSISKQLANNAIIDTHTHTQKEM